MAFKRDLFTGELIEYEPTHGTQRKEYWPEGTSPHDKRRVRTPSVWGRPQVSNAMRVHPKDAARFNEGASTGVYYNQKGQAVFESRQARAREMKRREYFDRDAGYGDQADSG